MPFPPYAPNVIEGNNYTVNSVHRDRMHGKAQWTITPEEELNVFILAYNRKWLYGDNAWGLYFVNKDVSYLGVAQDHITRVFIAKFVNDVIHNNWHGYPADHQLNQQDIPEDFVLKDWLKNKILPKAKIMKIAKGKPCKL